MSRPLLGLLLATVVFFALWITMLKPHGSDTAGNGTPANPSLGQLNGAVAAAHHAVATSDAASAAHGGDVVTAGAGHTASATHTASAAHTASATHPASAAHTASATHPASAAHATATPATPTRAAQATRATRTRAHTKPVHHAAPPLTPNARLHLVTAALGRHRVLAMLFYNPAGADDRMVRRELAMISTHGGAVVKLAIPLSELARYSIVTRQVPVTGSPTLVIVDGGHGATELVGFSDRFEIAQRVDDALAVH